jgi:carboxyl-terminal processing protease
MGSKLKKILISIFLIFVISVSFGFGFYFGKLRCKVCPPEEIDFSLFWEAYDKIKENFVDKEKIDVQKIIYGAISGMVKSLGDPYTSFFSPEESKEFEESVKGVFEGVGMEIGIKNEKLTVISPLEGTPAKRAGILAEDEILKIDDKSTEGMNVDEAASLIRGPKGTKVKITIFRKGWQEPKEIELVRELIKIPTLKWEIKEGDIAYIKIYQFFSERTEPDFAKAASEILKSPAKKIILDLRDNPGGALDQVIDVSGWFLERGKVVVIEDDGKEKEKFYSPGPGRLSTFPTVVLINKGSASGAEILAGALRDNRGIILIGENSFGKGSVQKPFTLSDNSTLKITISKWLTPKEESISDVGLKPDIEIKMTEEDYEKGFDPQLEKAIEIIKGVK